jgi:hypothetical protein
MVTQNSEGEIQLVKYSCTIDFELKLPCPIFCSRTRLPLWTPVLRISMELAILDVCNSAYNVAFHLHVCFCFVFVVVMDPDGGLKDVVNIAMVSGTATQSLGTGKIWLGFSEMTPFDPKFVATLVQYGDPFQLIAGSNMFGVLDLTERRYITPSFSEMMGFTPVSISVLLLFSLADVP